MTKGKRCEWKIAGELTNYDLYHTECGGSFRDILFDVEMFKFCPNCGKRIREVKG